MKRHLLIIAIFLLAGAVVNVAVAWGCAYWPERYGLSSEPVSGDDTRRMLAAGEEVRTLRDGGESLVDLSWGIGYSRREVAFRDDVMDEGFKEFMRIAQPDWTWPSMIQTKAGLPLKSLFGEYWIHSSHWEKSNPREPTSQEIWCIQPPWLRSDLGRRHLPLKPLWFGFVANSIFYATLLWLLVYGYFALRRFLRVRRGLCPKCVYPMGESSICTECGCELPKRASTT